MELRKGYKQTEIGVIPVDWKVVALGAVLKIRHGKSQHEVMCENGKYPILATGGEIGRTNVALYSKPTVMIGRKGTIDVPRYMDLPFWTIDTLFYSEISDKAEPKFIYYKFCLVDWYLYNEASGVPSLNAATIEKIPQAIPPTKTEQTAIANALSDADTWIQSLTRLIAKKRQIKQGAMQTLLNPYENGRLKEGWVLRTIEDMCIAGGLVRGPFGGALKKEYFVDRGYKVYEQRNAIYKNIEIGSYFIDPKKYQDLKRFSVKPKDFIISCSGTIGRIYQLPSDIPFGVINQALLKLTIDNKQFSEEYFYHYFRWERFQEKIIDSTQGGAMKNLVGMPIFKKTEVALPAKLNEQTRVATVLTDIDKEITALETKLNKAQQIKQGMMQNLLTGRIRLI